MECRRPQVDWCTVLPICPTHARAWKQTAGILPRRPGCRPSRISRQPPPALPLIPAAPPRISPPADLALATTANLDHAPQSRPALLYPRLPMHPPTRDGSSPPCPSQAPTTTAQHRPGHGAPRGALLGPHLLAEIGLDEEGLGGGRGGERREGDEQRAGGGEEDQRGDEEQEKQQAKTSTTSSLPSSSERSSSSACNNLTEGGRCRAQPVAG
jgi:hypothetical protein